MSHEHSHDSTPYPSEADQFDPAGAVPAPPFSPHRLLVGLLKLVALAVVAVAAATSVVFVDETQFVIVERLGHIVAVYDRPEDRGLHFKLPWPISMARRFDCRVHLFDPPGRELFTRDKKNITVDTYVCWRIARPNAQEATSVTDRPVVRFFRSLGTRDVAEARLDSRVRSILATELGRVELSELMSVTDSEAGPPDRAGGPLERLSQVVRQQVVQRPDEDRSIRDRLGIEVVDVRIKRINFPLGNQQAVFERMKSERRKIADRYRSAGQAENTMIKSQADRQYSEILAKAEADAERIRGQAEAEAISILNKAHAQDPDFYRLLRTLDTYRKILNERTTLVLSASSELFKLLTKGLQPDLPAPKPAPELQKKSTEPPPSGPDVTRLDRLAPASVPSPDDGSDGQSNPDASSDPPAASKTADRPPLAGRTETSAPSSVAGSTKPSLAKEVRSP